MNFTKKDIEDYAIKHSKVPSDIANNLEAMTRSEVDMSQMLIGKLEASVLGLLINLVGAKRVLEFGTFTGYSALCMAEFLPKDGEVHTLDINESTVSKGKEVWGKSNVANKIFIHIGDANETMKKLTGTFDLVFIDADKVGYKSYLEYSLSKLSNHGVIVLDNVLWSGKVLEDKKDESTKALDEINKYVHSLDDYFCSLLPIRDGMMILTKKNGSR